MNRNFLDRLLEAAQLAYGAAQAEAEQLDDKAEEVVQAQIRAAYI